MALTFAPQLGTLDLVKTNGYTIGEVGDNVIYNAQFDGRMQSDMAAHVYSRLEGRRVRLNGIASGIDYDTLRTKVDDLLYRLSQGEQPLRIYQNSTDADTRLLDCQLESEPEIEYFQRGVMRAARFDVSLRSRAPSWRRKTSTVTSFSWTSSPKTQALTANNGTAQAWPVISIENLMADQSGIDLRVSNVTHGKTISVKGVDIRAGQTWVIDMQHGRFGSGSAQQPRPVSVESGWWHLEPQATTTIELVSNASFSGSGFQVTVTWQDQYWTF